MTVYAKIVTPIVLVVDASKVITMDVVGVAAVEGEVVVETVTIDTIVGSPSKLALGLAASLD